MSAHSLGKQLGLKDDELEILRTLLDPSVGAFDSEQDLLRQALMLVGATVAAVRNHRCIATVDERNKRFTEIILPFIKRLQENPRSRFQ
jgi:hypothetical protein